MQYQTLNSPLRGTLALIVSASLLMLAGCNPAASEPTHIAANKTVKLMTVNKAAPTATDVFLAQVDAANRAQLSFQVGGEVVLLNVKMAQQVKKGDLLATLDPSDLALSMQAAKANYELAENHWQRTQQLYAKKLVSEAVYEQSQTGYEIAKARLTNAQTQLDHTRLNAPFDGTVAYTFIKQNQIVGAKQQILNLIDTQTLDATFSIPVDYVKRHGIKALFQQEIWVSLDNAPTQKIPASLKEISTEPNTDTNTFKAIATIERPGNQNILSGMTGLIHLAKEKSSLPIRLPDSAWLEKTDNKGAVWVLDPTSSQVAKVAVSINSNGEITEGLADNALVVVAGVNALSEGDVVSEWQREEGI